MGTELVRRRFAKAIASHLHDEVKHAPRAPNAKVLIVVDTRDGKVKFVRLEFTSNKKMKTRMGRDLVPISILTRRSKRILGSAIRAVSIVRQRRLCLVRCKSTSRPCLVEISPVADEDRSAVVSGLVFEKHEMVAELLVWHLSGLAAILVSPGPRIRRLPLAMGIVAVGVLGTVGAYHWVRAMGWGQEFWTAATVAAAFMILALGTLIRPHVASRRRRLVRYLTSPNVWRDRQRRAKRRSR